MYGLISSVEATYARLFQSFDKWKTDTSKSPLISCEMLPVSTSIEKTCFLRLWTNPSPLNQTPIRLTTLMPSFSSVSCNSLSNTFDMKYIDFESGDHSGLSIPSFLLRSRLGSPPVARSEERRVGKECRSRW